MNRRIWTNHDHKSWIDKRMGSSHIYFKLTRSWYCDSGAAKTSNIWWRGLPADTHLQSYRASLQACLPQQISRLDERECQCAHRMHTCHCPWRGKCIVVLCYESRHCLHISQKLHDPPQIHAIEHALRHAVELASVLQMLVTGWRFDNHAIIAPVSMIAHPLTLLRSSAPARSASALAESWLRPVSIPIESRLGSTAPRLYVMPRDRVPAR